MAADAANFIKKGRGWRRRLCRRIASLRSGGDSAYGAEGGGLPLRAMLIKSALRDWLSVSYGMIRILVIGSLRSPPKGETAEWYMKYMTLCFSSPYFSFPLEGKSREAGKGVRGRAPIGWSIAVLTANRRPPERSDAQRTHFALCELDL